VSTAIAALLKGARGFAALLSELPKLTLRTVWRMIVSRDGILGTDAVPT
jgi:hypothetical protein